jgi:hypothetical protein
MDKLVGVLSLRHEGIPAYDLIGKSDRLILQAIVLFLGYTFTF